MADLEGYTSLRERNRSFIPKHAAVGASGGIISMLHERSATYDGVNAGFAREAANRDRGRE